MKQYDVVMKSMSLYSDSLSLNLATLLTSYVGTLLDLCVSLFPHLQNKANSNAHLYRLLRRLTVPV